MSVRDTLKATDVPGTSDVFVYSPVDPVTQDTTSDHRDQSVTVYQVWTIVSSVESFDVVERRTLFPLSGSQFIGVIHKTYSSEKNYID